MLVIPWFSRFGSLFYALGALAVFILFFRIRYSIRRRGFGWISFLPTLAPGIPTAIAGYSYIRSRIVNGPCLPEDGCTNEGSGLILVFIIATLVIFALCLGFELLVVNDRRRMRPTPAGIPTETAAGSVATTEGTTVGSLVVLVFLGGVSAFLFLWIVHTGIMRIFDRFVLLDGWWDVAVRIALCGLLGIGYAFVEKSRMPKTGCAVLLSGLLSTIVVTLWVATDSALISVALTGLVAGVLIVVFKRPRIPYFISLFISIAVALLLITA
ncbi:MAG: hypothetical protein WC509_04405 [Candidatus Izemoplasmatales bacterium]